MNLGSKHTLKLFDEFIRTDLEFAKRTEEGFPWWNRSARPEVEKMRNEVEGWFARYDPEDAARLRREFRSKRAAQHVGALFELFIHEHLVRAGFEVECQIELPGTANKPDFLVLKGGVPVFYVEAKAKLDSDEQAAMERRRQEVMEVIRHLRSPDFFVSVVIHGRLLRSVDKSPLKRALIAWLKGLDHESEAARFAVNPYARRATFAWQCEGLTLEFHAMPRTDSRGRDLGTFLSSEMDGEARLERTDERIAEAFEKKAEKYGKLDMPFLIAIDLMDFTTDSDDVSMGLAACWGTVTAPKRQGVSGVLLAFVPNIAAAVALAPLIVLNPSASHALGVHAAAFRRFVGHLRVRVDSTIA